MAVLTLAACSPSQPPTPPSSAAPLQPPAEQPAPPATDVAPPESAGQPYADALTFMRAGAQALPAWFICDGVDDGLIHAVGLPDSRRMVTIWTVNKHAAATLVTRSFKVGLPDPGAGQVYYALTGADGQPAGNLHAFNPGALTVPGDAFTPTFTSVEIGNTLASCRWVARTRLLAFSHRRVFLITQAADGSPTYQTFNFKEVAAQTPVNPDGAQRTTTHTLEIKGGTEADGVFTFSNAGVTYLVSAKAGTGAVTIRQSGKPDVVEGFIAYEAAPRR